MICERCDGEGWVKVPPDTEEPLTLLTLWEPCPDCDGCGIAYCCEGEHPT